MDTGETSGAHICEKEGFSPKINFTRVKTNQCITILRSTSVGIALDFARVGTSTARRLHENKTTIYTKK